MDRYLLARSTAAPSVAALQVQLAQRPMLNLRLSSGSELLKAVLMMREQQLEPPSALLAAVGE